MYNEHRQLVEQLNKKLHAEFGEFTATVPLYRIAWSDDQYEYRDVTNDPVHKFDINGNKVGELTGIHYLPKYKQWLPSMWVLERCIEVNEASKAIQAKYSYEPVFPFRSHDGKALPPDWDICWMVVGAISTQMREPVKVYKDESTSPEAYKLRIDKLVSELFGNETSTGDALSHKEGISVPNNYGD